MTVDIRPFRIVFARQSAEQLYAIREH